MKEEIITFKVDEGLSKVLKSIPNRSEFIRHSIMNALNSLCPLCNGTGFLSEAQKKHWEKFSVHHSIKKCEKCEELYISCDIEE